jgi:hypothetical protein
MSLHHLQSSMKQIKKLLDQDGEACARATGVVQRTSAITGSILAQVLILGWLHNPTASLERLVVLAQGLGICVSASALHQRLTAATVQFLQKLLHFALQMKHGRNPVAAEILHQFSAVLLVDSSILKLSAHLAQQFQGFATQGTEAMVKLQTCFDYLSGCLYAIELEHGRQVDQLSTLIARTCHAGALMIFDLGYFSVTTLRLIAQAQAFFVVRYKYNTKLFDAATGQPLDINALLQQQPTAMGVYFVLLGHQQRLPVRLVAYRLSDARYGQRRARALANAKDKKHTPSAAHLAQLRWSIILTNTSADQIADDLLYTVYSVRWQIELLFKLWKSHGQLKQIPPCRGPRMLCQLYALLIGLVLFHGMTGALRFTAQPQRELSLPKALTYFQDLCRALLSQGWDNLPQLLTQFEHCLLKYARKSQRTKKPSTYRHLVLKIPLA